MRYAVSVQALTATHTRVHLRRQGSYDELRDFCARMLAIMCFRLPEMGATVYDAILPSDDETSLNKPLLPLTPEHGK